MKMGLMSLVLIFEVGSAYAGIGKGKMPMNLPADACRVHFTDLSDGFSFATDTLNVTPNYFSSPFVGPAGATHLSTLQSNLGPDNSSAFIKIQAFLDNELNKSVNILMDRGHGVFAGDGPYVELHGIQTNAKEVKFSGVSRTSYRSSEKEKNFNITGTLENRFVSVKGTTDGMDFKVVCKL